MKYTRKLQHNVKIPYVMMSHEIEKYLTNYSRKLQFGKEVFFIGIVITVRTNTCRG